jgi:benzoyl-CoA reductase subunit D
MITAGIDAGAGTVKAVVVRDDRIIGRAILSSGTKDAVSLAYDAALQDAGIDRNAVEKAAATGAGRKLITFAPEQITEITAAAKGARALLPDARTVIDIGAEGGRAVRMDANGRVLDFAVNEKCAAGAGAFVEAMARALETTVEEIGMLSLKSTRSVPVNAQCAVFAESEVVTLIHAKTPKEDIARAVHDAIGDRVASMVRRIGTDRQIVLVGGLARNAGFVESLGRSLESEIVVPDEPEFAGAFGAALAAAEE